MSFRRYLTVALFGFAVLAQVNARAECECPTDSVEEAIRQADRIFRGEVVSASIASANSETIEFVVTVNETIRGTTQKQYHLTTAMPASCGVAVRLGFNDMFVLGFDERHVSSCTGSGRAAYMKYPFLAAAVALVDLPVSGVTNMMQLLNKRFHSGLDRALIDEFFELVTGIESSGHSVTSTVDRIEYRGVVVYFTDGIFEKVGAL